MTVPKSLTPSKLRILLVTALTLILLSGGTIFYLAYNRLSATAIEAGDKVAASKQSQETLKRLQSLQDELESEKDTIAMTSNVVADSQNYAYQDLLVNDLTVYAQRAGIGITNISFISGSTGSTGGAPAASATNETAGAEAAGGAGAAPAALSGLRKTTVNITLANPTDYRNLLNFLLYVEQNLTKLKVSQVSMTHSTDGMTVDTLNLEVHVR